MNKVIIASKLRCPNRIQFHIMFNLTEEYEVAVTEIK